MRSSRFISSGDSSMIACLTCSRAIPGGGSTRPGTEGSASSSVSSFGLSDVDGFEVPLDLGLRQGVHLCPALPEFGQDLFPRTGTHVALRLDHPLDEFDEAGRGSAELGRDLERNLPWYAH